MNVRATLWTMIPLTVGAIALLILTLIWQPFTPDLARGPNPAVSAEIGYDSYADEQAVMITTERSSPLTITVPASGRVTGVYGCSENLSSGTTPVSVDGKPILALASPVPWFRDITYGTRGEDVSGLQAELTRLGFDVTGDDGAALDKTFAAFRELRSRFGLDRAEGLPLALSSVIWLPMPVVPIARCSLQLGDVVATGAALADSRRTATRASIIPAPNPTLAGPRTAAIGNVSLAVDESGQITGTSDLDALAATAEFIAAWESDGDGRVKAKYRLTTPITVAVVPPSAVRRAADGSMCIVDEAGKAIKVRVVGAQLGQSFVQSDSPLPPAVILDPPTDACE